MVCGGNFIIDLKYEDLVTMKAMFEDLPWSAEELPQSMKELEKLSKIAQKLGYKLAFKVEEFDEGFNEGIDVRKITFKLTLSNPKSGGNAVLRTSLRESIEDFDKIFAERVCCLNEALLKRGLNLDDEYAATEILLGFMEDGYFRPTSWWNATRIARIALEFGFDVKMDDAGFSEEYSLKCSEKSFETFLKKYLEIYGLPAKHLDNLLSREKNKLLSTYTYFPTLSKYLPRNLSILYSLRSLKPLNDDEVSALKEILFEGDPDTRKKMITGITFYLKLEKDPRLDRLLAEYVRMKADRIETFEIMEKIFGVGAVKGVVIYHVNCDNKDNFSETIDEAIRKFLNIESIKLERLNDTPDPKIVDMMLEARSEKVQIRFIQNYNISALAIEVYASDPILKELRTRLIAEFPDITHIAEDDHSPTFLLIDEFLSKSMKYVEQVRKIERNMLSKISPTLVKLQCISSKTIEITSNMVPTIEMASTDTATLTQHKVEKILKSFDLQISKAVKNLTLKIGGKEIPVKDIIKLNERPTRLRETVIE